jgi:hypothetical protein
MLIETCRANGVEQLAGCGDSRGGRIVMARAENCMSRELAESGSGQFAVERVRMVFELR